MQRRYDEAELAYKKVLASKERALGPDHPEVASSLSNIATVYYLQGRMPEAKKTYELALQRSESIFSSNHPVVASRINNVALAAMALGDLENAETLLKRAVAIDELTLSAAHPSLASHLNNLGWLYVVQQRWQEALSVFKRATGIYAKRFGDTSEGLLEADHRRAAALLKAGDAFQNYVQSAFRLVPGLHPQLRAATISDAFIVAQWARHSEAAASLAQMAARTNTGSPKLAKLVRETQDLENEWQRKDKLLITARSQAATERNATGEKVLIDRVAAIEARLDKVAQRLAKEFPNYASLSRPKPISAGEAQSQLRDDEALVLFLDASEFKPLPEETFVWVITKTDVRGLHSDLGTAALQREVGALRCGLDATAWYGEGALTCSDLLKLPLEKTPPVGDLLPFDTARAHELYKSLLGEAEDLIKGKHLLVVPSGALTKLPFQALVTETPKSSAPLKDTAWLTRKHAITVLPSVSSLKALRRVAKPSQADRPIIGFGNPLLDGPDARFAQRARQAREFQKCRETVFERVASLIGFRGGVTPVATRDGPVDLAHLKQQTPLPETADELCAVARDLGADVRELRLGAKATETEIKRLNARGDLVRYRVVHFATQGTLAGQLSGTNEPGLILTPPDKASEHNDGYLSGSEIASLKLDADWVILSACNTAAGDDKANAEALSGLARAFFYAGARALLVSHWEVYSDATVKLITRSVRAMSDGSVGRAEALRRVMLDMIDSGAPHEAHPSYWAPFVLVGEGAAAASR